MPPKPEVEKQSGLPSLGDEIIEDDPIALRGSVGQVGVIGEQLVGLRTEQNGVTEAMKGIGYSGTSTMVEEATADLDVARKRSNALLDSVAGTADTLSIFEGLLQRYQRDIGPARAAYAQAQKEIDQTQALKGKATNVEMTPTETRLTMRDGSVLVRRALGAVFDDRQAAKVQIEAIVSAFSYETSRLEGRLVDQRVKVTPAPADASPVRVRFAGPIPPGIDLEELKKFIAETYAKSVRALKGDGNPQDNPVIEVRFGEDMKENAVATYGWENGVNVIKMGKGINYGNNQLEGAKNVLSHEVIHAAERSVGLSYDNMPPWLFEGLADHVMLRDIQRGDIPSVLRFNEQGQTYDAGYKNTAMMIEWIRTNYDPQITQKLISASQTGAYSDSIFLNAVGAKSMDEAWTRFAQYTTENNLGYTADPRRPKFPRWELPF